MIAFLKLPPSWSRSLALGAAAALATVLAVGSLFVELDYDWALYNSYDDLLALSQQREAAGDFAGAQVLAQDVEWREQQRFTHRYSWAALFEGPTYLLHLRLTVARILWKRGRLQEAEAKFREALALADSAFGDHDGRRMLALVRLADFLVATGRRPEAVALLDRAEAVLRATEAASEPWVFPPWIEDDYEAYGLRYQRGLFQHIAELRQQGSRADLGPPLKD